MKISKGAGMKNKVMTALVAMGMMASIASATVVSKNGIANDSVTGLMWQDNRDVVTVQKDWERSKGYCKNLTLGGYSDWRLPSIYELETILDQSKIRKPNIIDGFLYNPKEIPGIYWSSSSNVNYSSYGLTLILWNSSNGGVGDSSKNGMLGVRCVRGNELKYNSLISFIKSGKLNTSHEEIESIVRLTQSDTTTPTITYNIGGKRDTYQGYAVYPISCSTGKSADVIFNYDKPSDWLRYVVHGTQSFKTIEEAANYICGNK